MAQQNIPVYMHDDQRDVVKVGNVKFNAQQGSLTLRIDINTLRGEHFLLGKAIELGLVEAFEVRVQASEYGAAQVAALPDDEDEKVEQS